jgi:hypothetical protein
VLPIGPIFPIGPVFPFGPSLPTAPVLPVAPSLPGLPCGPALPGLAASGIILTEEGGLGALLTKGLTLRIALFSCPGILFIILYIYIIIIFIEFISVEMISIEMISIEIFIEFDIYRNNLLNYFYNKRIPSLEI